MVADERPGPRADGRDATGIARTTQHTGRFMDPPAVAAAPTISTELSKRRLHEGRKTPPGTNSLDKFNRANMEPIFPTYRQ